MEKGINKKNVRMQM